MRNAHKFSKSAGKTVISIALILKGLETARANVEAPRKSSATLVVVPPHLIDQWENEIEKFAIGLKILRIYNVRSLMNYTLIDILESDCVICPIDILESDHENYFRHLLNVSNIDDAEGCPTLPPYSGQRELSCARGIWLTPRLNDKNRKTPPQSLRNASARYTHIYLKAISTLRNKRFDETEKGVPLEYFEWERVIVDEIHVS